MYRRCPSAYRVSKARLDLPDPETPVRTTNFFLGISTVTFLRLCCRAPVMMMRSSSIRTANYNRGMKFLPGAGMARLFMVVLAVAAAACDNPASPTDDLEDARRTWRRQGIENYSFTVHQDCFCVEDARGPFRVRIASSVIVSVTDPATGAPRAASTFVPLTVEMLFDR